MNELPSHEFRKTFSRLTDRTRVTVHGHVIGEWVPAAAKVYLDTPAERLQRAADDRYDTQPVRAVPKVRKR